MSLNIAAVTAALNAATDAEHAEFRKALKARVTPESAAAAEAFIGKGYACTVVPSCGRVGFRTAGRASKHGTDAGGHTPAAGYTGK